MMRNAWIGAVVWLGLLIAGRTQRLDLGWIELLFLFGPFVIVPLGLELTHRVELGARPIAVERVAHVIQLPCAVAAAASFFFNRGAIAASLAVVWLAFCGLLALGGANRIYRRSSQRVDSILTAVAFLYVSIGGAWLVASRFGLTPLGFQEPIVLLTAVHFHYAGFAAPLLARSTGLMLRQSRMGAAGAVTLNAVLSGVLAGPALLAAGFVIGPGVKLVAALVLAASEVGLALCFCVALRLALDLRAWALIGIAAASVIFSMALAALWAIGEFPLQPFVQLAEMARLHGTANAFGFTLSGLLGWICAVRPRSAPGGGPLP